MRMRLTNNARVLLLTVALATALMADPVFAQSTRSGGGDARLQSALQQLTAEKAQLQAENAALRKDAEDAKKLRKENDKLTKELEYAQKKLGRTESLNDNMSTTLDTARQRLDELVAKYRELAVQFRNTEVELSRAKSELNATNSAFLSCANNNDEMAEIALDALDRYKNKGCFGKLREAEPFTGISKARVGNLVDDYQYRVARLKLDSEVAASLAEKQAEEEAAMRAAEQAAVRDIEPAAGGAEDSADAQD